jgi:hypothetical protein
MLVVSHNAKNKMKMKKLSHISLIVLCLTILTVRGQQQYFPNYTVGIPVNDTLFSFSRNSHNCAPDFDTQFKIMIDTAVSGLKFFVLIDSLSNTVTIPPYGIVHQGDTLPILNTGSNYLLYISSPGFIKLTARVKGTPQVANELYSCGTLIAISDASACISNDGFSYMQSCTVNNTTSVLNLSLKNKILISPNPFSVQTTLQTDKFFKDATLTVYNSYGQEVKQIKNISGQTITLHRDNLSSGLYFIRLTQYNKTIATDKLVIIDN